MAKKKPTHVYIVECCEFTSRGAHMRYYTGITNNPARRVAEHLEGKGALYLKDKPLHRMVVLNYQNEIYGHLEGTDISEFQNWPLITRPTINTAEKIIKALDPLHKQHFIKTAFEEVEKKNIKSIPEYLQPVWWKPFWKQCSHQCHRVYAKIGRHKVITGVVSIGTGGGSDCSECGSTGGVFHELEDCVESHGLDFCNGNCSEWETCKRPYRDLGEDVDDYCDDLIEVDE